MPRFDLVVGFTGDGDAYCPACAEDRWGPDEPTRRDSEGNAPSIVFGGTDGGEWGLMCGRCNRELLEPDGSLCDCRDGCPTGDCPACSDEDYDDGADEPSGSYESDGCDCADCVAAAAWTQDVS